MSPGKDRGVPLPSPLPDQATDQCGNSEPCEFCTRMRSTHFKVNSVPEGYLVSKAKSDDCEE